MKFLVDAQLPPILADWLRRKGYDATHALNYGNGKLSDRELYDVALAENRILISKDEDFFHLATRPGNRCRLLWLRVGNCRTKPLLSRLENSWADIVAEFQDNQMIIEMR